MTKDDQNGVFCDGNTPDHPLGLAVQLCSTQHKVELKIKILTHTLNSEINVGPKLCLLGSCNDKTTQNSLPFRKEFINYQTYFRWHGAITFKRQGSPPE